MYEGGKQQKKPPVRSKAPYNFIPFSYQPYRRYEAMEDLPRHDEINEGLLSGQIDVTLTAETPVCVSDGKKEPEDKEKEIDFVRGTDGRYQIPGSSLRGLLRQTMQILGMGLVRPGEDFANRRFYYRKFAAKAGTLAAPVAKEYKKLLSVKTNPVLDAKGNPRVRQIKNGTAVVQYSTVETYGGYLHCENGAYYIQPVKATVQLLPRRAEWMKAWKDKYTMAVPVWYKPIGDKFDIQTSAKEGYLPGTLVSPGFIFSQNTLYLFPEEDPKAERIPLSKEDRLSYEDDYKDRANTLEGTQKDMRKDYWKLPEKGDAAKPVFYKRDGDRVLFGMSRFLRVPYRHKLAEGLPASHRVGQELFLDYPYAVMGFASDSGSYRSRISVGDLPAEGDVRPESQTVVLGMPKPTFFPNYVQGGKDYNQEEFRLAGYKQYWMKKPLPGQAGDKVNTVLKLLPVGTRFSGTIRYRNLSPDELGLLLWCLQLEPGCRHTMGQGKPYGYGRVKLEITAMREYDVRKLYGSLQNDGVVRLDSEKLKERVEKLIECYEQRVTGTSGTTVRQLPHIQDFLYMKRHVCERPWEVSYLELKEHNTVVIPLKPVAAYQARWSREPNPDAAPHGGKPGKMPVHS